ncbi:MAG: hypothetical protein Q9164_005297 [Protoblastenia rupestris]
MTDPSNPNNYIAYGPEANCTLAVCPVTVSVYQYRPSLAANTVFLALFGLALIIHIVQGINIIYLGPKYARFSPSLYYWIFIPCDIISLVLQAVGGALSSESEGSSDGAVYVSIAGLSFQVFTLCVFIALSLEYAWRYSKSKDARIDKSQLPMGFKIFIAFLTLSTILILMRCIYRIDELSLGYEGPLIRNEELFIGLEGVVIIIAAFFLNVAHPGPVFGWPKNTVTGSDDSGAPSVVKEQQGV